MRQITRLTPKHLRIIEYWIAHPASTQAQVAKEFSTTASWISQLYNSTIFREEMDKRLKEHWKGAVKIAQKTMISLAEQGDRQAAQYILDTNGYKPKEEIDLNNKVITVTIDD